MERRAQAGRALGALVCLLAACAAPQRREDVSKEPAQVVVQELAPVMRTSVLGHSIEGRAILCRRFGNGSDTVLILASIHGSEGAGTPLLEELARRIEDQPRWLDGRTVLLVPVVNPDGLARERRHNARGVDLNRNFAAPNRRNTVRAGREPLSEPESQILARLIQDRRPRRIISIHQPLACLDYDGPGEDLARHMARFCEFPVKKLGSRPGSLGSYAGNSLEIPTVTFELPKSIDVLDTAQLWRRFGPALVAAILYPASRDDERIHGELSNPRAKDR